MTYQGEIGMPIPLPAVSHRQRPRTSDVYLWRTRWVIEAPPEKIWEALSQPEDWPGWWSYLISVHQLSPGDVEGLGAVRRFLWRTRLPYRIGFDMRTLEVVPGRRLLAQAAGDVDGTGTWHLRPLGTGTEVIYEWRFWLGRPWMRRLAPIARPLFAWNHAGVMRAGGEGLGKYLGVPVFQPTGVDVDPEWVAR